MKLNINDARTFPKLCIDVWFTDHTLYPEKPKWYMGHLAEGDLMSVGRYAYVMDMDGRGFCGIDQESDIEWFSCDREHWIRFENDLPPEGADIIWYNAADGSKGIEFETDSGEITEATHWQFAPNKPEDKK